MFCHLSISPLKLKLIRHCGRSVVVEPSDKPLCYSPGVASKVEFIDEVFTIGSGKISKGREAWPKVQTLFAANPS